MTPGRVSEKVVLAKLAVLQEMLRGISTLPLASPEEFLLDPRMVAAGESFLRRAIEALLDLARHLLAKGFGEVVPEYASLGPSLARRGVVSDTLGDRLRSIGGYRNRLVHGYDEVGGPELYGILTAQLADVRVAAEALRVWLAAHPDRVDTSL
jgi:uncharacterized protein YutE (UPF0331/DUF86 family)